MKISFLQIKNFKSIQTLTLENIESALILVGQNSVGKSSILTAIAAVMKKYTISASDFNEKMQNIEITMSLSFSEKDLELLFHAKKISSYRRKESWMKDFHSKLPSFQNNCLTFTFMANKNGSIRYYDEFRKNNRYIPEVLPTTYFLDAGRNLEAIQGELLAFLEDDLLNQLRLNCCLFEHSKKCKHCFSCIGLINQKTPEELSVLETEKLLEYKLYHMNLKEFSSKVNDYFGKNSSFHGQITYELTCHTDNIFQVQGYIQQKNHRLPSPVSQLGKGMRSIYLLSLLQAYMEDPNRMPSLVLMEDPEIYLHPQLQKTSSKILYRLSRQCQVIFTTHSPNLLFQFHNRQIRQIVMNSLGYSAVRNKTNLSLILDDLGYSASDLLNVGFVFIVEGKQDKSRLPLLLEKYYSDIYRPDGSLSRISIITTNSCTNIKTYANLKYMNQVYLKDQFLMIRDSDGKDREQLTRSLCRYYKERSLEDMDKLPRVTEKNVLVLKYYSFENYFLNPVVMSQLGVIPDEDSFYEIFLDKWKEYFHRIRSGQQLIKVLGHNLETVQDVRNHMEEIKIYLRGHNLYDIFYGSFKKQETELLKAYIDLAPREDFKDILDTIDRISFFENRKR